MKHLLLVVCLVTGLGACAPDATLDNRLADPEPVATSIDDVMKTRESRTAYAKSIIASEEDELRDGFGGYIAGNDPNIPDHPLGGEDFELQTSLPFIYEMKSDPTFCESLDGLRYEDVEDAMARAGFDEPGLETRIRQMICMTYYREDERARLAAHRMLARLDTSDDLGMALAGPKVERKARFYAILTLATSRAGPDKLAAWRAAKARGWESAYAKGTDLDRISYIPTVEWYGELMESGQNTDDLHLRYNYEFRAYFNTVYSDEIIAKAEAERIAAGIPPQSITPKPDTYFRTREDVIAGDWGELDPDPQAGAAHSDAVETPDPVSKTKDAPERLLDIDEMPEGYTVGNDPDIPDHPIGGVDFKRQLSLPYIYEFNGDPSFCDSLRALDYEAVGAAMERAGLEARSLETRIRQMICMSYYRKNNQAVLAAHRMLARLDTSDDLGMALAGPKVEEKARLYAIDTLATSRAGPDKLAAWRAAKARGWEYIYDEGTDLDDIASIPISDWFGEMGEVGQEPHQAPYNRVRYNYEFWMYFGEAFTRQDLAKVEAERLAEGIPPQELTPKPDSYFRTKEDVIAGDWGDEDE